MPPRALLVPLAAAALLAAAPAMPAQADSLDLTGALALARARSPVLAAADAAARSAAARVSTARSARAPRLSADVLYLRFQDPPAATLGPLGRLTPIPQTGYFVQVAVQQPVYTGGRVAEGIRAATWLERSARHAREQAEVELTAGVAHAYDAVLLARALLGVAEESAAVLDSAVAVAQASYDAGTVARIDVLRAETRRTAVQVEVRAARAALAAAAEQLAVLLGIDPATAPSIAGALAPARDTLDDAAVVAFLARARGSRPDVAALGAAAEAAERRAAVARASLRPTVALYAASLTTRPELVTERRRWATDWYGGLVVSWPLYDFGAAAGEADAARAEAAGRRLEVSRITSEAIASVLAHRRELARAAVDIAAGRENVARAERALMIAQDRYAEGAGIQLEVLEAQADLARARADLLRAIHAHRAAAVELRRAVGLPADASLTMPDAPREDS